MINGKKYLTINTDASFCPDTKAGGYAFYIRGDDFKLTKAGSFKYKVKNPTDAEAKCIINALHTLSIQSLPQVDVIVINTDSKTCIDHMSGLQPSKLYGRGKALAHRIKNKCRAEEVKFKHVKAHTGKNDSRSWVNEWCDQQAKVWMRKKRAELENKVK